MKDYLDIIMRSTAVYIFMVAAFRLVGKKELSQLNTSDIVLVLLISNAVQNAMVGPNTSLSGGLIAAVVLFLLNFALKKLLFKSSTFRNILNNKPEILIHDGVMDFDNLSKLDISDEEIQQSIREHGIDSVKNVKLAILEIDGNISVISGDGQLRQTHFKRHRKHQQSNKN